MNQFRSVYEWLLGHGMPAGMSHKAQAAWLDRYVEDIGAGTVTMAAQVDTSLEDEIQRLLAREADLERRLQEAESEVERLREQPQPEPEQAVQLEPSAIETPSWFMPQVEPEPTVEPETEPEPVAIKSRRKRRRKRSASVSESTTESQPESESES